MWISIVSQRNKAFLEKSEYISIIIMKFSYFDTSNRHPTHEIKCTSTLIVGATLSTSSKWLLTHNTTGTSIHNVSIFLSYPVCILVVDIKVSSSVSQNFKCFGNCISVPCKDRRG